MNQNSAMPQPHTPDDTEGVDPNAPKGKSEERTREGNVVPFAPRAAPAQRIPGRGDEPTLDPEALAKLKALAGQVLPLAAMEKQQKQVAVILTRLADERQADRVSMNRFAENVGTAMNQLALHVETTLSENNKDLEKKIDDKNAALGASIGDQAAQKITEKTAVQLAASGKRQTIFTIGILAIFAVIIVCSVIAFVRWNKMDGLRDKTSALAKENAQLEKQRDELKVETARTEESLKAKREEIDTLESKQSKILQQLQGTSEAISALQGARNETQASLQKLQQLAVQKLIPGSKSGEFFVEIEPATKPFEAKNGKTYIRVK